MPGKKQEQKVLVGAATVCGEQFLLLKRSCRESFLPDIWGIPAGWVEFDEDPGAACARELAEETGLQGDIVCLIGYSTFGSRRDDVVLSNIQLNFLVQVSGYESADELPAVQLDKSSHSAARWISLTEPENDLLDSFTKEIFTSTREIWLKSSARADLVQR
jgi:8-oxo-dGTP pyrophosphatase MutT (NUDIX family)